MQQPLTSTDAIIFAPDPATGPPTSHPVVVGQLTVQDGSSGAVTMGLQGQSPERQCTAKQLVADHCSQPAEDATTCPNNVGDCVFTYRDGYGCPADEVEGLTSCPPNTVLGDCAPATQAECDAAHALDEDADGSECREKKCIYTIADWNIDNVAFAYGDDCQADGTACAVAAPAVGAAASLGPRWWDAPTCSFTAGDASSCTDTTGCSYTAAAAAVAAVAEACDAPTCSFTAGNASSCTGTAGCSYTAAAAEVVEACVDVDGSGDDCSGFSAGNAASCGACDYTAPQAAVAEACDAPTCSFTAGDASSCTGTAGCSYTAAAAAVAAVAEACDAVSYATSSPTTSILTVSADGPGDRITYQLRVSLSEDAANLYALVGTSEAPLVLPRAFQVGDWDMGGVSAADIANNTDAEYDSWVTIGATDGGSALSSIGIDWDSWTEDGAALSVSDGVVFLDSTAEGATGEDIVVAQLTLPTDTILGTAKFVLQGNTAAGDPEAWQAPVEWTVDSRLDYWPPEPEPEPECFDIPPNGDCFPEPDEDGGQWVVTQEYSPESYNNAETDEANAAIAAADWDASGTVKIYSQLTFPVGMDDIAEGSLDRNRFESGFKASLARVIGCTDDNRIANGDCPFASRANGFASGDVTIVVISDAGGRRRMEAENGRRRLQSNVAVDFYVSAPNSVAQQAVSLVAAVPSGPPLTITGPVAGGPVTADLSSMRPVLVIQDQASFCTSPSGGALCSRDECGTSIYGTPIPACVAVKSTPPPPDTNIAEDLMGLLIEVFGAMGTAILCLCCVLWIFLHQKHKGKKKKKKKGKGGDAVKHSNPLRADSDSESD